MRITCARGRRILRPSFLAAAVASCVSYRLRCSGHVACGVLHRVERRQRVAVVLRVALGWCPLAPCGLPCVEQHAACVPLQVASVASPLLHCERCTLHRACGMLSSSGSDVASCARVQGLDGGVLRMFSGDAAFESVEISDTSAGSVRLAWRGRSGREAEWGGGVQAGGVVMMYGESVRFKGGSIARSKAVRDPRCCQLCVLHEYVAWGALYVAWCLMLVASFAAHGTRTF